PRRRLLDKGADPVDDVARSFAVLNDLAERLPRLLQIGRAATQPAQSGPGVDGRCGDWLFHFMGDRGRELTHGGDAVRVRQLHLHVPQRLFCPLALGDVPRDASVADEAPRLIKHRQARNRYVALAAVGGGSRELKVTERQVGLEGLPMLAPGLRVRLQVGYFPPRLADFRARRRRVCKAFGELLTGEAMLRIGFPVHVEGELYERAKALLAVAQT